MKIFGQQNFVNYGTGITSRGAGGALPPPPPPPPEIGSLFLFTMGLPPLDLYWPPLKLAAICLPLLSEILK
jgi:hypothetical protein